MQRRVLGVLIACLVAAIAISAVAFGPAALRDLGSPKAPGQTGTGPQATSIEKPTWLQGDTWTYTVNTTSAGLRRPTWPTLLGWSHATACSRTPRWEDTPGIRPPTWRSSRRSARSRSKGP